jgi:TRAP-type C4-dicarboxylate transport system substrate-binding protein
MNMNIRRLLAVAAGSALLCAVDVAGPKAFAKELKLATFLPPTHRIVKLYEDVAKEIAADSKGDLTIKVYAGGTLGAGPFQQYKRAVEGVADIADICHAFHAKVFSRTMLTVLPGASTSASDATTRLWNVAPMLADDYKEVHNVYMYSVSQAVLTSREKPIRNIADLKGAKVLTPGAAFAPIVGAWGASPVPMDLNEMFNALSTGVVDMVALPATSLTPPFRLAEIAKYTSRGLSGLFNPCGAIMNKDSYAALTPSQKAVFDKHTGKSLAMRAAKIFDDWEAESLKFAKDTNKIEVIELGPDVRKALFDAARPAVDKILADMKKDGVSNASEVYAALNK